MLFPAQLLSRSLLLAAFSLSLSACAFTSTQPPTFDNPIIPGDWSDPGLIRVGEDYYSVRSSFGWQPGLPIAHSRDLIHWEPIGHAFQSHPALEPGDTRGGIWGSEIGYNPNTGQYLIYAPTRGGDLYVFNAPRPGGPYTMRLLGEQLGIDPGFFADADGRLYLIAKFGTIWELEPDGLRIKRRVGQIDVRGYAYFEGPDLFRRGDYYYCLFSDGGTLPHEPSTISTLRARSLEGPWETDPGNPVMFATDIGARFEGPAHGTLIDTPGGEWFIAYHAHEPAFYSLGRQMLLQRIVWTEDGWWRAVTGAMPAATPVTLPTKVPAVTVPVPNLRRFEGAVAQSDEFDAPTLGLQWFFTCAPDFSGAAWSLAERPGFLRIHTRPGDLGSLDALPGVFQQRVIGKAFTIETKVTFEARDGREAAGLHLFHDPMMNLWLASTARDGEPRIEVGKYNLGERADLWSEPNSFGATVHLRIVVDGHERATFFYSGDGRQWRRIGESLYFGAGGHHLRSDGQGGRLRGDPDLGWVGRYKVPGAAREPRNPRLPNRRGNTWTGATFGIFAVRDGAPSTREADFDFIRVTKP
jgi:xylan 1,4-beta-xylosidase